MVGYKYDTEEEAIIVRKQLADYKGLPVKEGDVTIYWMDYTYSEIDSFYYFPYIDGMYYVLGLPIEFDVTPVKPPANG